MENPRLSQPPAFRSIANPNKTLAGRGFRVNFLLLTREDSNMSTQPVHQQKEPALTQKDASRQILAEEAAREEDPKKLLEIISALTKALEETKGK